jgi:hypothetical protein
MRKTKQNIKQKEITRIRLSDKEDLIASVVNDEKLDLRVWMNTDKYKGWTKRGLRFYFFDGVWEEFKKLIGKVDKKYQEIA